MVGSSRLTSRNMSTSKNNSYRLLVHLMPPVREFRFACHTEEWMIWVFWRFILKYGTGKLGNLNTTFFTEKVLWRRKSIIRLVKSIFGDAFLIKTLILWGQSVLFWFIELPIRSILTCEIVLSVLLVFSHLLFAVNTLVLQHCRYR